MTQNCENQKKLMGSAENQNKVNMMNEDDQAWIHSSVIANAGVVPMVLNAVIELNVLEIIDQATAAGPEPEVSATYIVSKLPQTSNRDAPSALDRMLRLLAAHSLLSCRTRRLENGGFERLYGVTKAGKLFIKTQDKGSLSSYSLLSRFHAIVDDLRCYLKDAVVEGMVPFHKAHNMSLYEYLQKDPEMNEGFDKAMGEHAAIVMNQILKLYNGFEGLTSLVDVGGGHGIAINMIISKYPSIRGINFDLPRVIKYAPSYKGIENVEGDMFKEVPKASAILLKWVLHNWSDEDCLKILKNCYEALPDGGRVMVVELVFPDIVETSPLAKYVSVLDNIMSMYFGAKERTEEEFKTLAMATGFSSFDVACHAFGHCLIEFHK